MPNPKLETYKNKATNTVYDLTDANAQASLTAILDGTSIDSFADVESALAGKVDTVNGKGLSTNDYDATAKGIVDTIQNNVKANTQLISDTVGWINENLIDVGNSVSDWFATSNNGLDIQSGDISTKVTATITKSTGSIAVSNYVSTGYWWMSKKVKLKKNTDYIFGTLSASTTIKLVGSNNGSTGTLINTFIEPKKINSGDYEEWWISIYPSNFSCSNLMAKDARILDDTFRPYHNTTAFPREEQAVLGARNLNATDYTKASALTNITATFNSNGTITANGTTTANESLAGGSGANFTAKYSGLVRIADSPSADVVMALYDATAGTNVGTAGQTVNMVAGHNYRLSITFLANKTFTNVVVNPLIVIATDTDNTPSPYAMTNKELTDVVAVKQLTSSDDLNNITTMGRYSWGSSVPTNSPANGTYKVMEVFTGVGGLIEQIVYGTSGEFYYLRTYSQSWGAWYKFQGTAVS